MAGGELPQSEYAFELPKGLAGTNGAVYRWGTMRKVAAEQELGD